MGYKSNIPGSLIIKLGAEVDTDTYEVSVSYNEVAKYAAVTDGIIYLVGGNGVIYPMAVQPASHVLTFADFTLTYSDDNARVAVLADRY